MLNLKGKVDTTGVRQMAQSLAQSSGKTYAYVLRSEVGSMIKIAAMRQKVASAAQIKKDVREKMGRHFHEPGGSSVVIVDFKRFGGRTWFAYSMNAGRIRGVGAYMVYDTGPSQGHHLPDSVWADFLTLFGYREEATKAREKEVLARRGLQLLSWLQMGDALGVTLSALSPGGAIPNESTARGARGPGGRVYQNGTAYPNDQGAAYAITVINRSPLAIKNNGQYTLDVAIAQRVRGFQIAMAKGVFTDLKLRSARWRGIFVQAA